MSRFLSSKFSGLKPYVPGEQPRDKAYVKLNTNESPYPPSPAVIAALEGEGEKLNLYSDPTAKALISAIAEFYGRDEAEVFAGNGSDEVLAFIFNAFCDKTKGMAFPEIGYGFYPVFCDALGIEQHKVAMREDLSVDISGFNGAAEHIVIANPNAQTGLYVPLYDIKTLLSEKNDRLVIVDEAYCDFGAQSALELLDEYDNLIIVGTLSKSRQLAGGRVGFALTNREIVGDLEAMKYSFNPYNLNRLSILAGAAAIKDREYFELTRNRIIEIRESAKKRFGEMGFKFTDSRANFILISKDGIGGEELYLALKEKGVLVRFLSEPKLRDWVRVSIGSEEQMETLFQKTKEVLEEKGL